LRGQLPVTIEQEILASPMAAFRRSAILASPTGFKKLASPPTASPFHKEWAGSWLPARVCCRTFFYGTNFTAGLLHSPSFPLAAASEMLYEIGHVANQTWRLLAGAPACARSLGAN
jgi:hypothetical protein